MISFDGIKKSEIRTHYELATLFYRLLWGVHIHHGLWQGDESSRQAQRQLVEHLLEAAAIPRGAAVVDIGCGMGGSSIHLAKHHGCHVTGVTLSSVQRRWAASRALLHGVGRKTRFLRGDAEAVEFDRGAFDYLWSVECTEHLFDKPAFFQQASQWIRPGGGVALCAWLAGDEPHSDDDVKQVEAVCDAMLCPSLGTAEDYKIWLADAGFEVRGVEDLTPKVARTWEICKSRASRSGLAYLARVFGRNMIDFVGSFDTMLEAYNSGAMKYASIVGVKRDGAEGL
jgi:tocopherol O-methyltransferase